MATKKKDLLAAATAMGKETDEISKSAEKKLEKTVTGENVENKAKKEVVKPFKKPNSDYYRLDLVLREVVGGKMAETIKTDYKGYVETMAAIEGTSITKYIQSLIDRDMNERKATFEEAKKLKEKIQK